MNWEKASFFLGIFILALQAWNLYISNNLKLWAMEKFVTKADFLETVHLWTKADRNT